MKNSSVLSMFILTLTMFLLCQAQQSSGQTIVDRIPLKPGPEDMVLDTLNGDPGLIISCCGRREADKPYGEMIYYKLLSGEQLVMKRLNEPEDILFRPHGIYLDEKHA